MTDPDDIRALLNEGKTYKQIQATLHCSPRDIAKAKQGATTTNTTTPLPFPIGSNTTTTIPLSREVEESVFDDPWGEGDLHPERSVHDLDLARGYVPEAVRVDGITGAEHDAHLVLPEYPYGYTCETVANLLDIDPSWAYRLLMRLVTAGQAKRIRVNGKFVYWRFQ